MFGRCGYLSCDCALCYTRSFFFGQVWLQAWLDSPAITEAEGFDRLSESEADETENLGNATGSETSGLPQKRKKYSCSYRKEYNKRFPWATDSKKAVLIIPHGNTDTERLFSHLGLNKTKLTNSLSIDTLNSLLTIQFNVPQKCYEFKPTKEIISKCKNAMSELKRSM